MRIAVLVLLAACAVRPAPTTKKPPPTSGTRPAVIGETFTLSSKILDQDRVINVYLPPDYATSGARYPVLYMPDGGLQEDFPHVAGDVDVSTRNGVIRPVIVVGVENIDRRHDVTIPTVTPSEQKAAPHAGGSTKFRQFFRDELRLAIDARYRTTAETALIGESLAGHFVIETFLVEPTMFDSYIAIDPSLQWSEGAIAATINEHLVRWPGGDKQLYVAWTSDLKEMVDGVEALRTALGIFEPAGLTYTFEPMTEEHHNSIFALAGLRGIRTVFAP